MNALDRYAKLKERVEALRAERDKAQGALDQLLDTLQAKYQCATVEEAKQKLADLEFKYNTQYLVFHEMLEKFEQDWREQLGLT